MAAESGRASEGKLGVIAELGGAAEGVMVKLQWV